MSLTSEECRIAITARREYYETKLENNSKWINGCRHYDGKTHKCHDSPAIRVAGGTAKKHSPIPVHRIAFILKYGFIPNKWYVKRKCKNRYCTNPKHLQLSMASSIITIG